MTTQARAETLFSEMSPHAGYRAQEDGYVYVSDSHVAIRYEGSIPDDDSLLQTHLPALRRMFDDENPVDGCIDLSRAPTPPVLTMCEQCGGHGHLADELCDECEGMGMTYCKECGSRVECAACSGTGAMSSDVECDECCGSGLSTSPLFWEHGQDDDHLLIDARHAYALRQAGCDEVLIENLQVHPELVGIPAVYSASLGNIEVRMAIPSVGIDSIAHPHVLHSADDEADA